MSIYFLSDLHLGASYLDDTRDREKRIVAFLDYIKDDAEAIYMLGDILDYWYEYRYVVPRGYVRFFGKLAELADRGIKIVWLKGNHDIWIFDYLPKELGIEVRDGAIIEEIYGKKFFMEHGDGVGRQAPAFRFIRNMFRNRVCQWLFAGIHPRWTVPFAYRWSNHSRRAGEKRGIPQNPDIAYIAIDESIVDNLRNFVREYHASHPDINYFLFGHVHLLCREKIAENCEMVILGEWIQTFSYAKLDSDGIKLLKWK